MHHGLQQNLIVLCQGKIDVRGNKLKINRLHAVL